MEAARPRDSAARSSIPMSDYTPDTEAWSIGCTILIFSWLACLFGGIALGFWVLK